MPKRSSNSRVLVWPKKDEVIAALHAWALKEREENPTVVRIGYFGSLAHGQYGVGSDADVVIIVKESAREWMDRPLDFNIRGIPVNVDLLVYTEEEWQNITRRGDRFAEEMKAVVWM
ncbi:MAG TPA: nucleotidyltransferase domain-containing protein [Thermoanaerobaculia bacterium]|jgi:predicted nucleotidyltransferase|nr:nucleotidyltransferase domain-containing protein [Thermoanaerobaculia bacterium]